MAVHPCPRCKTMIPVGVVYCNNCKPIAEAQAAEAREKNRAYKRAKYNRQRDPKYSRFYNSKDWKILSRTKLQSCGYKCEARVADECKRKQQLAVEVHHIKPIKTKEGWDLRLEWDNLMGVCMACHNILDGKNFGRRAEPGVIDLRTINPRG